jgi:hypothetical protein
MAASIKGVDQLFDIAPDWVTIEFNFRSLSFWHGAACILSAEGHAAIQLPASLEYKARLWGLYRRQEILAHEMVHCGRCAFNEPKYEEFLATMGASRWRQWLAGAIQSPWEALLLLGGSCAPLVAFLWGSLEGIVVAQSALIILILSGLVRLSWRKRSLYRCLHRLFLTVGDQARSRAILYRLTDQEITLFARSSPQQIKAYAQENQLSQLRWRAIFLAYFSGQ